MQRNRPFGNSWLKTRTYIPHERVHIQLNKAEVKSLLLRFSKIQQLARKFQKPVGILFHDRQVLAEWCRIGAMVEHVFQRAVDQRERCPDLMGYLRKKVNFCAV